MGPFRYPQRLKKALLGALEVLRRPQRSSEGPKWPDLVPTATGWCNWVGNILTMCSGPFRDLYDTPGAPKRTHFGPILEAIISCNVPMGSVLGPFGSYMFLLILYKLLLILF